MAYLSKVKSNGNTYVYLAEYIGKQQYSRRRERHIYSFGRLDVALRNLEIWKAVPSMFPKELSALGYGIRNVENLLKEATREKTS